MRRDGLVPLLVLVTLASAPRVARAAPMAGTVLIREGEVQLQRGRRGPPRQVRDFARISSLDDEVEGDNEDEVSFMEIHEYVRVGAVLVLTLMAEGDDDE